MRRVTAVVHVILMILLFAGVGIANLVFLDTREVSAEENRRLAPFPSAEPETLASGAFAEGFERFIDDRFVGRRRLIELGTAAVRMFGPGSDSGIELVAVSSGDRFTAGSEPVSESGTDEPDAAAGDTDAQRGGSAEATVAPENENENAMPGADTAAQPVPGADAAEREAGTAAVQTPVSTAGHAGAGNGGASTEDAGAAGSTAQAAESAAERDLGEGELVNEILLIGNRGFEVLGFQEASGRYFVDAVNLFAAGLDPGTGVYLMIVPSHLQQVDPEVYNGPLGADQRAAIRLMYSWTSPEVEGVDVFPVLDAHRGEYIYFRTDHHWTARGAYWAYTAFAGHVGIEPVGLDSYEMRRVPDFVGSMYLFTRSERLRAEPDTVEVFMPFVGHRYLVTWNGAVVEKPIIDFGFADDQNKYQVFVSSDRPHAVIETEADTDRAILVLKDSYGNAFLPFLIPHYREVHVIDPRYFEGNAVSYAGEHGIDDVLFISYFAVIAGARGYARNLYRVVEY